MTTVNEATVSHLGASFERFSKATESALHLQREMVTKWSDMWPGMQPEEVTGRRAALQKDLSENISTLMRNQREVLKQYRMGFDSLEQTFRALSLENAEEMRDAYRTLYLKALDVTKSTAEVQVQHLQEAIDKMT